jgi:hypothetical protein
VTVSLPLNISSTSPSTSSSPLLYRYWEEIVLAIIGEQFDVGPQEICGAVISVRNNEDIISIWNKSADNTDAVNKIRDQIRRVLKLPTIIPIEYKRHQDSLTDKSSYRNPTMVWRANPREHAQASGGDARGAVLSLHSMLILSSFLTFLLPSSTTFLITFLPHLPAPPSFLTFYSNLITLSLPFTNRTRRWRARRQVELLQQPGRRSEWWRRRRLSGQQQTRLQGPGR